MEIFKFHEALFSLAQRAERDQFGALLLTDMRAAALYKEANPAYLYKPYNLKRLRQCPRGSLGHAYAAAMDAEGLTPEFFAYQKVEDVLSFFSLRLRKTHDIYHILTGFGTSEVDEIGLQAFYLGQIPNGLNLSIVASTFIWAIDQHDPAIIAAMLNAYAAGYQSGLTAAKLHGVVWEDLWNEDVASLRQRFHVTPQRTQQSIAA